VFGREKETGMRPDDAVALATRTEVGPSRPDPEDGRPGWTPPPTFSFSNRSVDIDGQLIRYVDEGEGPPLLFVDAFVDPDTGSILWRDVIVRLRDRFRCVALDVPSASPALATEDERLDFGAPARILESLVRTLDLKDLTLVLHDLGGPVALGVALREQDRIQALVVTESFGWPLAPGRFVGLTDAALTDDHLREVDRTLRTVLNDRPVLLVFGQESPMVKAGFPERWRERFPDAGLLLVEGSHRLPMADAPDLVARAIKGWWREEVFAA
jgi:pimeloyl-ACP methyl ester carboxylesterase